MPPHVLVDTDDGDPVEPGRIVDEHALALARTASLAVFQATPSPRRSGRR
jgi:hypothetical protein